MWRGLLPETSAKYLGSVKYRRIGNTVGVTAFHLEAELHEIQIKFKHEIHRKPLRASVCVCVFALLLEELEVI